MCFEDVPNEDRPRERLMTVGADALSHAELLAILLRTGTRSESAVLLASRILQQCGSLRGLVDMSIEEMTESAGSGRPKRSSSAPASSSGGAYPAVSRENCRRSEGHPMQPKSFMEAASLFEEGAFRLLVLEYEKSSHFTGNVIGGHPECIARPPARSVPGGDQMQQRLAYLRS